KAAGATTISSAGTYEGTDYKGALVIAAPNVTLRHDCIEVNGGESLSYQALSLREGADNFEIEDSTVRGLNDTSESAREGLSNDHSDPGATATDVRVENVGTPFHQLWTVDESYAISNGVKHKVENYEEHQEVWWADNAPISADHDTFLNPSKQTAVIFSE